MKKAPPETARRIGLILRRWRHEQNLTLASVADEAGISLGYLSQLERGRNSASLSTLERVSQALGKSLAELTGAIPMTADNATLDTLTARQHAAIVIAAHLARHQLGPHAPELDGHALPAELAARRAAIRRWIVTEARALADALFAEGGV